MTDIANAIEWSNTLEEYFKATGEQSHGLSWIHKKSEARFAALRNYIDLPVIILGVLNGATSVGSGALFPDPRWASIGVGVVALVTAILSTISSYFKWAQRAEAHRIASLQYAKLHRYIVVQLRLPRDERLACAELLKYVRDGFDRLAEISPLVPQEVIVEFNAKFKKTYGSRISLPSECNGLESVRIYDEHPRPLADAPSSLVSPGIHLQRPGSDGAASAFAVPHQGEGPGDTDGGQRPVSGVAVGSKE